MGTELASDSFPSPIYSRFVVTDTFFILMIHVRERDSIVTPIQIAILSNLVPALPNL